MDMRIQMLQSDIIPLQLVIEREVGLAAGIVSAFAGGVVGAVAIDVHVGVLARGAFEVDDGGGVAAVVAIRGGGLAIGEAGGEGVAAGAGLYGSEY